MRYFDCSAQSSISADVWRELTEAGAVVLQGVFEPALLAEAKTHAETLVESQSAEEKLAHRSLGSLIRLWREPFFVRLITYSRLISILSKIGAQDLRFSNGFLFSKPPHAPQTFWHHDWWLWDEPASYTDFISQLGVLVPLQNTDRANGCLKIIPGSHRRRHAIHDALAKLDNNALRRMDDPRALPFQTFAEEVDLPTRLGDLIVIDARLLHASHPNASECRRSNLTFWFFPNFSKLSESVRARIGTTSLPPEWPRESQEKLKPLLPSYAGNAAPSRVNDFPGANLE